jgi:hypothetical protein
MPTVPATLLNKTLPVVLLPRISSVGLALAISASSSKHASTHAGRTRSFIGVTPVVRFKQLHLSVHAKVGPLAKSAQTTKGVANFQSVWLPRNGEPALPYVRQSVQFCAH